MKDKNPEEMNNSGDLIFGIEIRKLLPMLSFLKKHCAERLNTI